MERLTKAEKDILDIIVKGMSNKEIASQMGKSVNTVRNQVHFVLTKMGIKNRKELIYHILSENTEL